VFLESSECVQQNSGENIVVFRQFGQALCKPKTRQLLKKKLGHFLVLITVDFTCLPTKLSTCKTATDPAEHFHI
jgi:hypothetical protein